MNADLIEIIKAYATKSHGEVSNLLEAKSKPNIISILLDLLTTYFNDKNSSTLRESVVVINSGFIPKTEKIGYNGYRQNAMTGKHEYCEAKPKNINTNDGKPKKLNGGGNFTDYNWGRFKKDKKANPTMLVAGFIDGRLIYIFKFPFNSPDFIARLETQLKIKFPDGRDVSGEYVRSANFGPKYYQNAADLSVYVDADTLAEYKNYITAPLYPLLEKKAEKHGILDALD